MEAWRAEIDALMRRARQGVHTKELQVLSTLQDAGPLRNMEAARRILRALAGEAQAGNVPLRTQKRE